MNENPEDTADERDSRRSFLEEVTARPREIDVAMEDSEARPRQRCYVSSRLWSNSDSMIVQNDFRFII